MDFAAIGWFKQVILLMAIISICTEKSAASLIQKSSKQESEIDSAYLPQARLKTDNKSSIKKKSCQEIGISYQGVYSFETDKYYIGICQLEGNFYYHRQSKIDGNSILIPAESVFGGSVFKAISGKTVYFVGKDGSYYYSSVMSNNNEIVLEPEIIPTPISFDRYVADRGISFSLASIKFNNFARINSANWQAGSLQNRSNENESSICIKDKSVLDPNFENWQNLLGKSADVANDYAINNGHNFVYDEVFPERASIETKEGKVVNLNIAATNEVIEQVCVTPTEDI